MKTLRFVAFIIFAFCLGGCIPEHYHTSDNYPVISQSPPPFNPGYAWIGWYIESEHIVFIKRDGTHHRHKWNGGNGGRNHGSKHVHGNGRNPNPFDTAFGQRGALHVPGQKFRGNDRHQGNRHERHDGIDDRRRSGRNNQPGKSDGGRGGGGRDDGGRRDGNGGNRGRR